MVNSGQASDRKEAAAILIAKCDAPASNGALWPLSYVYCGGDDGHGGDGGGGGGDSGRVVSLRQSDRPSDQGSS